MNALQALFDSLKDQAVFSAAPVERWQPERIGEIDIRIDTQGRWHHEGALISRQQLVTLFASVLLFEDDQYYLVTPVEKMRITVDDVPFLVEESEWQDSALVLKSNVGEVFTLDADHPLQMRGDVPYVRVRGGLWARVVRSLFYDWVNNAAAVKDGQLLLVSAGSEFSLGSVK